MTAALPLSIAEADDVLAGLRAVPKRLPCRLLYDARGAELFEEITGLPEYYVTRSELALLAAHLPEIAEVVGPAARVIEPGSGAGRKIRMLLDALERPAAYVPIDVSREQLVGNARALRAEYPGLAVTPVGGDFTRPLALPPPAATVERSLVFFPGSTIGNFEPAAARSFLARFRSYAGPRSMLLLGVDGNRDPVTLVPAYDDAAGVTAAFNRNVLAHVNRTHRATFELDWFAHRAVWSARHSRIEMHLISLHSQAVRVAGETIRFAAGEPIITEHCYKHAPDVVASLLASAGWRVADMFPDALGRVRLWLASAA